MEDHSDGLDVVPIYLPQLGEMLLRWVEGLYLGSASPRQLAQGEPSSGITPFFVV
jgi:hypothetical protein